MQTITPTIVKNGKNAEIQFIFPGGLGEWYMSIGQGMGKAQTFVDEKQAYVMSDRVAINPRRIAVWDADASSSRPKNGHGRVTQMSDGEGNAYALHPIRFSYISGTCR